MSVTLTHGGIPIIRPNVSRSFYLSFACIAELVLVSLSHAQAKESPIYELETFVVSTANSTSGSAAPEASLSPELFNEEFAVWEPTDAADLLRYFPNVNVNKPAIGSDESLISVRDQSALANGRLWVLVDGFPISNPLLAGATGAPRLNVVDPQSIDSVELFYGPFSANYGGYAMGGVIHYKTRPPQRRSAELGTRIFWHDFSLYGSEDRYTGSRTNFRVTEKWGRLGLGLSGSYLKEDGNPQLFYSTTGISDTPPPPPGPGGPPPTPSIAVSGAYFDRDAQGNERVVYGSQGTRETTVGALALDGSYDLGEATLRFTSRYSEREVDIRHPETYLTDPLGNPVSGGDVVQGGRFFHLSNRLSSQETREEGEWLNGIGLAGELPAGWTYDAHLSHYQMLESENRSSTRIQTSPTAYWLNGKASFEKQELFSNADLDGLFGFEWTRAEFEDADFTAAGDPLRNTGGQTDLYAAFATVGWQLAPEWRTVFGLRADQWASDDGFAKEGGGARTRFDSRDEFGLSPKWTLEYQANPKDSFRLNLAQAYRFPLAIELFREEYDADTDSFSLSNPDLQPEHSTNIELSWLRHTRRGQLRVTVFRNQVDDAILQQFVDPAPPMGGGPPPPPEPPAYSNVDIVTSYGIEAFLLRRDFLIPQLEATISGGWMESEIDRWDDSPENEGNTYPGVPEWRGNASLRYKWSPAFETALGARYQSHIYERADNTDTRNTLGAVGERLIFDLSGVYRFDNGIALNLRIDNLFNEVAFTNRPERQRTFSIGAEWRY